MKLQLLKQIIVSIFLIVLLSACNKSSSTPDPLDPKVPGIPVAILPLNAETCSEFTEVPGESGKATIFFSWSISENATNYFVQVFESGIEINSANVTATETELTLEKGKSYTWSITARNNDEESTSSTSSFVTPGEAFGNFAPYAAEILTNFDSDTSEISISWIGSDEDGDTLTYDINIKDAGGDDILNQINLSETSLNPIAVTPGETYTISVISRDGNENYSVSLLSFKAD